MKITLNEHEFFNRLDSRITDAGGLSLYDKQIEAIRETLYEGLDISVSPEGVELDCGILHIVACNSRGEKARVDDTLLSCNYAMPGFPLEHNVTKVALTFDANKMEPLVVDMTIFPFMIPSLHLTTKVGVHEHDPE